MSDFKLPELPSDDELGITEEDLRAFDTDEADGPRKQGTPPPSGGRPARGEGGDERGGDKGAGRWRFRGPVLLVVMVALGWVASIRTGLPDAVPADGPESEFSAGRAMAVLREIARAPRPTGSPEHARVRQDLLTRLRALGLEPEIQVATALLERPGFARAATVRNVVARIPGTNPSGAILLTAHYDGAESSPAAGDNASGVVTLLEAVRAIRERAPLRNDVILLFTDAEEIGLLGAEAFVRDHPWMADVDVVVSFEMRGSGGPSVLFETADGNGIVVRALADAEPDAFGTSLGDAFFRYMPNDTDFTVFERAGKQGLNFAAIDNAAVYHTPRDQPSELSARTLQHHGVHVMAALQAFGDRDLAGIQAPDVVFFTLPVLGLVVYAASWVLPLSGLLAVLVLAVFFLARRGGARAGAVVIGLGVALVAISLGYGAGYLLVDQAIGAHVEAGRLPGALFYGEGWYVLAVAAAGLLSVGLLLGAARRRMSIVELALGFLIIPVTGAIALGFAMPLAAMQLQWPALAATLSVGTLALLGDRRDTLAGWAAALLFAVPVIFFMVPAVEFAWLAATLRQSAALGALMVIGFLLALPAVDALRSPNGWWMPLLALVVGAASLGLARLGNDVSPVSPVPSTLAYAYERGAEQGLWITDAHTAAASPESEVGAWLSARTGNPFDRRMDLGRIGYLNGSIPVAVAPPAATSPLITTVQLDTTEGIVRRVRLAIRSQIGAERLHFRPSGGRNGTRIASINGRPLTDPFGVQWADHWGVPDSMTVLELEMPAGSEIELLISEHHLRPSEVLGPGTFQRPPGLAADVSRWSDRAIFTTRISEDPTGRPSTSIAPPAVPIDSAGVRDVRSPIGSPPPTDTFSTGEPPASNDRLPPPDSLRPTDTLSRAGGPHRQGVPASSSVRGPVPRK